MVVESEALGAIVERVIGQVLEEYVFAGGTIKMMKQHRDIVVFASSCFSSGARFIFS